jgi:hypothetical protein
MPTVRTPTSGTISMLDLDKSITNYWSTPTANQNLYTYNTEDFGTFGFAYCYGNPGLTTPYRLSDYYGIIGYVTYTVTSSSVQAQSVTVDITPGNSSNGSVPGSIILAYPTDLPSNPAGLVADGAHWETAIITVNAQVVTQPFDVYFDGNWIGNIPNDGVYVFDNGGPGYANSYATGNRIYVDLVG